MTLAIHVRLPLTTEEHKALVRKAGDAPVAAYLRRVLGLPQRRVGRPPGQKKLR